MRFKVSILIAVLLLILPVYLAAQDAEKPTKDDEKTKEDEKKAQEEKAFTELQGLVKKTLGEQMTSEERDELFKQIDEKSYEYYKNFGWMDAKRTQNAIMYRVTIMLYKNRREDFLKFSKEVLNDKKLPEEVKRTIFQDRVKILRALEKYDVLLKEVEEYIAEMKVEKNDNSRINLLSYQHLKLLCYFNLGKTDEEFNKIVGEIYNNLTSIENSSYRFEVILIMAQTFIENEKYSFAHKFLDPQIIELEKQENPDDDSYYKLVQCRFYLGKIMVLEGKSMDEVEKIKVKMVEETQKIESYRMRTPANNKIKELSSFMRFREGMKAPDWTLKSVTDETEIKLSDYKGKIVIVCFWATWNAYSRNIMNSYLATWHEKYGDKDVVIINIGSLKHSDTPQKQKDFVADLGYKWLFVIDEKNTVAEAFGVEEIPQIAVINKEGIVEILGDRFEKIEEFLIESTKEQKEQPQTKPAK